MTFAALALRSVIFYRRTHVAVALGVASAVAVLAGESEPHQAARFARSCCAKYSRI